MSAVRTAPRRFRPWHGTALAGLLVLMGGAGHRLCARALDAELGAPVRLPRPLSELPRVLGDWHGEDVPLSEGVRRIALNDDFVNRRYRNRQSGATVNLYVAYSARPRTMLRHRPTVCYPSAGWAHLETRETLLPLPALPSDAGRPVLPDRWPALVHSFQKTGPTGEARITVLNYYVLNGAPTIDEGSFWALRWRGPNLRRDPARYVAQIQVAATMDLASEATGHVVRQFASAAAPEILALLPGTAERFSHDPHSDNESGIRLP